jgi:hypothetical protein
LSCAAPGAAKVPQPFRARHHRDDRAALVLLGRLSAEVTCALGRRASAYGGELPLGYAAGVVACEALGDAEGAALARSLAGTQALAVWEPPAGAEIPRLLQPAVDLEITLLDERLRFSFVLPAQWEAAADALNAAPSPADAGPLSALADEVGRARWPRWDILPEPSALLSGPPGPGRRGAVEAEIDGAAHALRRALDALPEEVLGEDNAALITRFVLLGLRRDTALLALDGGDPSLAVVLLEDVLGARPPAGSCRDAHSLAALALALHHSGDARRALLTLSELGERPGWEAANIVRTGLARLVVLPGAAVEGARR